MKAAIATRVWLAAGLWLAASVADNGEPPQIGLRIEESGAVLDVQGEAGAEWRFQSSTNLVNWADAPTFGTVVLDDAYYSPIAVGLDDGVCRFYRAVKTTGLYDVSVIRTIAIEFVQTNWQQLLTANYSRGLNLMGDLRMGGICRVGAGVRYKGNTSYMRAGAKKSINIEIDHTFPDLRLMGYRSLNLNNAFSDNSMMREALYFNTMQEYTVCPKASFVNLTVNGQHRGLYSFAQQVNADLVSEWFESNNGDRWKAPSGMGGGGGGFGSGERALTYLGTNASRYKSLYELKSKHSADPWVHLINTAYVLNKTPTNELRDKIEEVLAVDRWLWFLALENIFADEDSYWMKGADYEIYYEPESGRIHPLQYDGNESFMGNDVRLNPLQGVGNPNRPVIARLLAVPELRQRYLAHMRTAIQESFNPEAMNRLIDYYRALIEKEVERDSKRGFTMQAFTSAITSLKKFVKDRHAFLVAHSELRMIAPAIGDVSGPEAPPAGQPALVTARVYGFSNEGIDSVRLYYRAGPTGRFWTVPMLDDGTQGDGEAGDGLFAGVIPAFPAGTQVHYYIEARSGNTARTARFAPTRAERTTFSYLVSTAAVPDTMLVINELMASNTRTLTDPQGEYDDWIELRNLTDLDVDLSGKFLSDDPLDPRKWPFPPGTTIPSNGFLIVWADQDSAADGLHASFKLAVAGEQVLLVDSDENDNALLDLVTFGPQQADLSFGRSAADPTVFETMAPTPGEPNR